MIFNYDINRIKLEIYYRYDEETDLILLGKGFVDAAAAASNSSSKRSSVDRSIGAFDALMSR